MSKYAINDTTLIAIGDAIREKEGSTDAIPVANFADRIAAIQTGGGGGSEGGVDLTTPIDEMIQDEWLTKIKTLSATYGAGYAFAVLEFEGSVGDAIFAHSTFETTASSSNCGVINLSTNEKLAGFVKSNYFIRADDEYMTEVSPGVWRMIVYGFYSDTSITGYVFSSSYELRADVNILYEIYQPYSAASGTVSVSNPTSNTCIYPTLYQECSNLNVRALTGWSSFGKYWVMRGWTNIPNFNSTTYRFGGLSSRKSSTAAEYILFDNVKFNFGSTYATMLLFGENSTIVKRMDFKNCNIYAYKYAYFYAYNAYLDLSGVNWYSANNESRATTQANFVFLPSEGYKDRLLYFVEHMPSISHTMTLQIPKWLSGDWGQENVITPLTQKGYTVTANITIT